MIHINWEYKGKIIKVEPINREHTYENLNWVEWKLNQSKHTHPKKWDRCYLTGSDKKIPEYEVEFDN